MGAGERRPHRRPFPSPLSLSLGAVPPALWQRKEWAAAIMMQELRFAIRNLRRNPGFTALALVIMGLGIGANTTIFSMANATLLRPPAAIDEPHRIVQIGRDRPGQGFDNMAYPWFRDFRDQAGGLQALAAYTPRPLVVGRGADVEVLAGQLVTGDYFNLLGISPETGRVFAPPMTRRRAVIRWQSSVTAPGCADTVPIRA